MLLAEKKEYIKSYQERMQIEQFSVGHLYDTLLGLSKGRVYVINPCMKTEWAKPGYLSTRYFARSARRVPIDTICHFQGGWDTYLAITLLQKFSGSTFKFAVQHDLEHLITITRQIRHIKLPNLTISPNFFINIEMQQLTKNIKRTDAAIDDIVSYLFKRKYGHVNYKCEKQGASKDSSFHCYRELSTDKFSLARHGFTIDTLTSPESFYRLFKHDSFKILIADLQRYFEHVA